MTSDTEIPLLSWLMTRAKISDKYINKVCATLEDEEVDCLGDLRLLSLHPRFEQKFTFTTASKIKAALDAPPSSPPSASTTIRTTQPLHLRPISPQRLDPLEGACAPADEPSVEPFSPPPSPSLPRRTQHVAFDLGDTSDLSFSAASIPCAFQTDPTSTLASPRRKRNRSHRTPYHSRPDAVPIHLPSPPPVPMPNIATRRTHAATMIQATVRRYLADGELALRVQNRVFATITASAGGAIDFSALAGQAYAHGLGYAWRECWAWCEHRALVSAPSTIQAALRGFLVRRVLTPLRALYGSSITDLALFAHPIYGRRTPDYVLCKPLKPHCGFGVPPSPEEVLISIAENLSQKSKTTSPSRTPADALPSTSKKEKKHLNNKRLAARRAAITRDLAAQQQFTGVGDAFYWHGSSDGYQTIGLPDGGAALRRAIDELCHVPAWSHLPVPTHSSGCLCHTCRACAHDDEAHDGASSDGASSDGGDACDGGDVCDYVDYEPYEPYEPYDEYGFDDMDGDDMGGGEW